MIPFIRYDDFNFFFVVLGCLFGSYSLCILALTFTLLQSLGFRFLTTSKYLSMGPKVERLTALIDASGYTSVANVEAYSCTQLLPAVYDSSIINTWIRAGLLHAFPKSVKQDARGPGWSPQIKP